MGSPACESPANGICRYLFEWPEQLGHDHEILTRTLFRRREKQCLWLVVPQTPNYIVFHVNISLLDRLLMQVGHSAADDFIVEVEVREPIYRAMDLGDIRSIAVCLIVIFRYLPVNLDVFIRPVLSGSQKAACASPR